MEHHIKIIARNNVSTFGNAKEVLLYAHGFGCNKSMWDGITPSFSRSHRQVLFDYVGCGASDVASFNPDRYSSLNGYVQDLLEVCDALELESGITFVGHSVSCSVGILASIARPELFDRLVLIGPTPCFLNYPPAYHGGFEREDLEGLLSLMDQNYIGWASHLAPVVSGQGEAGEISVRLSNSFCSTDPVATKVFARTTFFSDNRGDLPLVSRPCLILQHSHDVLAPLGVGEYLRENLKGSTLKILDVTGHCAHMSHPALVVQAMETFLETTIPGP